LTGTTNNQPDRLIFYFIVSFFPAVNRPPPIAMTRIIRSFRDVLEVIGLCRRGIFPCCHASEVGFGGHGTLVWAILVAAVSPRLVLVAAAFCVLGWPRHQDFVCHVRLRRSIAKVGWPQCGLGDFGGCDTAEVDAPFAAMHCQFFIFIIFRCRLSIMLISFFKSLM